MSKSLDTALEQVQSARINLRSEIESIASEINLLEQENRSLPNQTASFGELKKAILELVVTAGARHAETHIRASIIDFAKGAGRDMSELNKYGKPLTLGELNGAIRGEIFPMANTRFLSSGAGQIDDLVLYAVLSGAVQEMLSRMLDQLSPADLGLKNMDAEPEMTRDEMNERIASNRAEIERLKSQKTQLESELKKLS
jgi:uncharacterized coiled-coil DUF342 family protein